VNTISVIKSINETPTVEPKYKASEGIDNHLNLNLIINADGISRIPVGDALVIVVEWSRYDRIAPNGNIVRIQTP
jgi:hypothetical protein